MRELKKGDIVVFGVKCIEMSDYDADKIANGDAIEIVRKTKKGTYIGINLRTSAEIGGLVKKDLYLGGKK